jgi:hypothetical protein
MAREGALPETSWRAPTAGTFPRFAGRCRTEETGCLRGDYTIVAAPDPRSSAALGFVGAVGPIGLRRVARARRRRVRRAAVVRIGWPDRVA